MAHVDMWGWFNRFYREALAAGDEGRQQLAQLYYQAVEFMELEPPRALSFLEQGAVLAKRLSEPCWTLFYDYWRCELYMFYIENYKVALDIVVKTAAEAHKPVYEHCPVRARVFRILIDAYLTLDPIGYAEQIRQTIAHMKNEIPMDDDTRLLLMGRQSSLAFVFDQLDEAIAIAERYLAASEHESYRYANAAAMLARFSYLRGDLETTQKYVELAEPHARRSDMKSLLATLTAWRALLALKQGNTVLAGRYYVLTVAQMSKLGAKPGAGYYDSLCDYLEANGELEKARALRDQELAEQVSAGSVFAECDCRLKRCRLLARNDLPLAEEIKAAREAAKGFIDPTRYLDKLDRLERGDLSSDFT